MKLIFGGAYQGKLGYAMREFSCTEADVYRCSEENTKMPGDKKIVVDFDRWILALVSKNMDVDIAMDEFLENAGEKIVICNDISCGVVPGEPKLRAWREAAGRAMTRLSQQSEEVTRIFCGLPTGLK